MGQFEAASKANGQEQIKGKELGKGGGDLEVGSHQNRHHPQEEKQNRRAEQVLKNQAGVHRGPVREKSANPKPSGRPQEEVLINRDRDRWTQALVVPGTGDSAHWSQWPDRAG